jgi:hypothetical protein
MVVPFAYYDTPDGLMLCKINPGGRCFALATQELLIARRGQLKPVPKRWLMIKRAPTIIWKPGASPDVTSAIESEMVDLQGASFGASELAPADQVFMIVGSGVLLGLIGFGVALAGKPSRDARA